MLDRNLVALLNGVESFEVGLAVGYGDDSVNKIELLVEAVKAKVKEHWDVLSALDINYTYSIENIRLVSSFYFGGLVVDLRHRTYNNLTIIT